MSGGGGSTTTSGSPQYLTDSHKYFLNNFQSTEEWLPGDMKDAVLGAAAVEPYDLSPGDYYSPSDTYDAPISSTQDLAWSALSTFSATEEWTSIKAAVILGAPEVSGLLGGVIPGVTDITDAGEALSIEAIEEGNRLATQIWTETGLGNIGALSGPLNRIFTNSKEDLPGLLGVGELYVPSLVTSLMAVGFGTAMTESGQITPAAGTIGRAQGDLDIAAAHTTIPTDILSIVSDLATDLITKINTAMDAASVKAASVIDSTTISTLIDSFEIDTDDEYNRSVARFSGGMADINAVQGSAFVIGMGLLERGRLNQLVRLGAELKSKIYSDILPIYMQVYQQTLVNELNSCLQEIGAYLQSVQGYVSQYMNFSTQALTKYIETFIRKVEQNLDSWKTLFSGYIQGHGNLSGIFGKYGSDTLASMMTQYSQGNASLATAVANYMVSGFNSLLQAVTQEPLYVKAGAELRSNIFEKSTQFDKEEYQVYLDTAVSATSWRPKMYMYYANALAALGSASQYIDERPSKLSSIMGGALGGAGAGAALGPIGMGVGALLGGFAGSQ